MLVFRRCLKTLRVSCRTGEKLQTACPSSSTADHCDRCLLCMCVLDTAVGECRVEKSRLLHATRMFRIPNWTIAHSLHNIHEFVPLLSALSDKASAFQATLISEQLSQTTSPGATRTTIPRHGTFHILHFTLQHCSEFCSTVNKNKQVNKICFLCSLKSSSAATINCSQWAVLFLWRRRGLWESREWQRLLFFCQVTVDWFTS